MKWIKSMDGVKKPDVEKQGKTVIEVTETGKDQYEYMIMFPDGTIEMKLNHNDAEKAAKKWYENNLQKPDAVGFGLIEWRKM